MSKPVFSSGFEHLYSKLTRRKRVGGLLSHPEAKAWPLSDGMQGARTKSQQEDINRAVHEKVKNRRITPVQEYSSQCTER